MQQPFHFISWMLSVAEIRSPYGFIIGENRRRTGESDSTGLEQVRMVGELERQRRILLDEKNAHLVLSMDLARYFEQLGYHERRDSERRFVKRQ
jgi:hypothetical protein